MNAADLARLTLAKRAFQATQPSDPEVQTGVRRARLAISRTKPRRRWFSKGLVFVVLAVGSLAYAKPQALGELVEKVLPRDATGGGKHLVRGPATEPVEATLRLGAVSAVSGTVVATQPAVVAAREPFAPPAADKAGATTAKKAAAAAAPGPTPAPARHGANATHAPESAVDAPTPAVSDWGRVGQALAHGDDTEALAALNGLSESDDQRTRDKADLGRAQLLMAHGDPDKACALARSLTHRRAGGRIERQAQLLLKSCGH